MATLWGTDFLGWYLEENGKSKGCGRSEKSIEEREYTQTWEKPGTCGGKKGWLSKKKGILRAEILCCVYGSKANLFKNFSTSWVYFGEQHES